METPQIPCFAITGHHRSGTSLVTSVLQSAGLHVGERLLGADPDNKHGHFEDLDFLDFHIAVLTSQGYSCEGYVLQKGVHVPEQHHAKACQLIDARRRLGKPWAWKDPRTTLFLNFWKDLVPELRFILLFRSPWEVVDSQFRRGHATFRTNPNLALQVWKTYNQAILEFAARYPEQCLLIEGPAVGPEPSLLTNVLAKKFGLALGTVKDCFDKEILVQHVVSHLPFLVGHFFPEAMDTYQELRARAQVIVDHGVLNATPGGSMDWALQHWHDLREKERQVRALEAERQKAGAELAAAQASVQETKNALAQAQEELCRAQQTLEESQRRHADELNDRLAKIEELQRQKDESNNQVLLLQQAQLEWERETTKLRDDANLRLTDLEKARVCIEKLGQEKLQTKDQMSRLQQVLSDVERDKQAAQAESQRRTAQLEHGNALADQLRSAKEQSEAKSRQSEEARIRSEAQSQQSEEARIRAEHEKSEAQRMAHEWLAQLEQLRAAAGKLHGENEQMAVQADQQGQERAAVQARLNEISAQLDETTVQLNKALDLVRRMESSKFWKLRKTWFKAKKKLYQGAA
jgi:hypothetical protein